MLHDNHCNTRTYAVLSKAPWCLSLEIGALGISVDTGGICDIPCVYTQGWYELSEAYALSNGAEPSRPTQNRPTTVSGFHGFHGALRTGVTKERVHAETVHFDSYSSPCMPRCHSVYIWYRAYPPCLLSLPHTPHYPVLSFVLLKAL